MPFKDTNEVFGLPRNHPFQVGRGDGDDDQIVEHGVEIPWAKDTAASYLYYDCTVGIVLDSGIVVHNRLPQGNSGFSDTLATIPIDDPRLDLITGFGVNIRCRDQYQDIVQRMGHARYWFRIWGRAMRVGYQVPIPGIRTIGRVPAIPYDRNPQWAYNSIAPGGNYSGLILWRAAWSLWYTTLIPPQPGSMPDTQSMPVADPSAHIHSNIRPPEGMQAPYSQLDDNART